MTGCDARRRLHIDLETFSSVDIAAAGSYRYMEAPDFEILLIAYAWDNGPVRVIDVARGLLDGCGYSEVMEALTDPDVVKVAHNADGFERQALRRYTGWYLPACQWDDTMHLAAYNGLPMSLDAVGAALNLEQQKIKEGVSLISYFCKPCKPTIANGGRTRNRPEHAPEKWARFVEYCRRDVEVEQQIYYRLRGFKVPAWEKLVRCVDAEINERGILIDTDLARAAVDVDTLTRSACLEELRTITGLDNPNSVQQLKTWLEGAGVPEVDSLNKATTADLLATTKNKTVARALKLRQLLGKTSTKKYNTMLEACSPADDRIRGTMQYYGAGRTGRWAGRLLQVQNLPQNHLERIDEVREVVRSRDVDLLSMMYDSAPDVLSQLIRTALVAHSGCTFLVADYSAIEARVIAYLSGCQWRMDVFKNGGDIYCSSASQMFKVPVVKHGENGHLRQKGKIAELACGYGGGVSALVAFGADRMGLSQTEMQEIVDNWRNASPEIPRFWRAVEDAAKNALRNPGRKYPVVRKVCDPERARENERAMGASPGSYSNYFNAGAVCTYYRTKDALICELPSGRCLSYWAAALSPDGEVQFMAQNQTTRKWERASSWGGRLVENIVQAFARDCLAWAMLRLHKAGYAICFSVHDEIICEEPKGGRTWQEMAEIMGEPLPWAPGLLLRADGYSTDFYMKD